MATPFLALASVIAVADDATVWSGAKATELAEDDPIVNDATAAVAARVVALKRATRVRRRDMNAPGRSGTIPGLGGDVGQSASGISTMTLVDLTIAIARTPGSSPRSSAASRLMR